MNLAFIDGTGAIVIQPRQVPNAQPRAGRAPAGKHSRRASSLSLPLGQATKKLVASTAEPYPKRAKDQDALNLDGGRRGRATRRDQVTDQC
jgi:hypothetical protein